MIQRATWSCLLIASMSACATPEAPPPVAPPPPEPPPTPVVSVEPPPVRPAATPPPPPPVEFAVAVEGACEDLDVASMEDGATLYRLERRPPGPPGVVFSRLGADGAFHDDPSLARGLTQSKFFNAILGFSGSFEKEAGIVLAMTHSRAGDYEYPYAWSGGRWHPTTTHLTYPYIDGTRLVSRATDAGPRFQFATKGHAANPDFSAVASRPGPDCSFGQEQVLTRPEGDVFVSGSFCAPAPVLSVAWWKPGGGAARLTTPPGLVFERGAHLEDAGPAGVFAFASAEPAGGGGKSAPFIGHFENGTWASVPLPFEDLATQLPTDIHSEPDGTLWLTVENTLYRRAPSGEWTKEIIVDAVAYVRGRPAWAVVDGGKLVAQRMPDGQWRKTSLPHAAFARDELLAGTVLVDAHGEPWINASYANPEGRGATAILRHAAPGSEGPKPLWCSSQQGVALGAWPAAASEGCATPLAVLLRIASQAPPAVDFPFVRKALAKSALPDDVRLVEVKLGGQRVLAAKVPSIAVGREVVSAVEAARPGLSTELVCAEPEVVRSLPPLEKRTGGLASNGK